MVPVSAPEALAGLAPPQPALGAVNELIAEPWTLLRRQLVVRVEEAIGRLHRDWEYDTGVRKAGPSAASWLRLWQYQVRLRLREAGIATWIVSPPGYEAISESGFRLAVPLQGTWSVHFTAVVQGKAWVWLFQRGAGLDVHTALTVDLRNFRMVAEARLAAAPADPDRPRLQGLSVKPTGQLRISSRLVDLTLMLEHFRPVMEPGGSVRFEFPLQEFRLLEIPALGDAMFSGALILRLEPTLTLQWEGELSLQLSPLGRRTLPFSWSVDTGLQLPLPDGLHSILPGPIPRDWGENPPADLTPLPPETDFLAPAHALEQRMAPHTPYGAIFDIVRRDVPPPAAPMVYDGVVDSAIWTGHYLAAESFRYAASTTPEARAAALERVRFVLGGIRKLFEVTGVPGLLARAALPGSSPLQPDPPLSDPPPGIAHRYYGPVLLDGEPWHGLGRGDKPPSRDSYSGVMMGLAYAFQLVPEADVREGAAALVTAALRYLLRHHWNVVAPKRKADGDSRPNTEAPIDLEDADPLRTNFLHQFNHQLAFLRVGKSVNPTEFGALYDRLSAAASATWLPIWGSSIDPLQEPYKFNLAHATAGLLLFLEEDPVLREGYMRMFRMLRRTVAHHRNAYYDLVSVLAELPAHRRAILDGPGGYDRSVTLSEEIRAILHEWLLRLPSVASPTGMPTMATPDPQFLQALFPSGVAPHTPVGSQKPTGLASLFALPVHKRPGRRMDFLWQLHPFGTGYAGEVSSWPPAEPVDPGQIPIDPGQPEIEGPSIDYLLPVWMASYLGVLPRP